ncbi:MAG TPA: hypothetical protein VJN96_11805 [Vicinamibacterales bacterium]|nr:hypothetical protein [Vicinamibacterales bacterium]
MDTEVDVQAFEEHLNSGREDLVSPEELRNFALTPGACTSTGHGCSCSCVPGAGE